jgi:hypothetical protein
VTRFSHPTPSPSGEGRSIDLDPDLTAIVDPDIETVPIHNIDMIPLLWISVQSVVRLTKQALESSAQAGNDRVRAACLVRVDVDERDYCRVVIGPGDQNGGIEWKDVPEEASHWLHGGSVVGCDVRVRSNGPLGEVTIRWPRL